MPQQATLEFEAIGTQWVIDLWIAAEQAPIVAKQIADRISQFDRNYSRFRADSWVTKIRHPGSYTVPRDFKPLFNFYQQLYKVTSGLVTPLIGEVMERAGYDAQYSLVPKTLKQPPAWPEIQQLQDNTLHVKYGAILDFGAAGKGYLVDLLGEMLQEQGIHYVIDAGGDIRDHSPASVKTTPVGLEDPTDPQKVLGTVDIQGSSLCASAGNRRSWGKYHHIMNPKTLESANDILAVWVCASTTMLADGLATCLFFVPPDKLKQFEFEYVILKADNSVKVSKGFPGELFHG